MTRRLAKQVFSINCITSLFFDIFFKFTFNFYSSFIKYESLIFYIVLVDLSEVLKWAIMDIFKLAQKMLYSSISLANIITFL